MEVLRLHQIHTYYYGVKGAFCSDEHFEVIGWYETRFGVRGSTSPRRADSVWDVLAIREMSRFTPRSCWWD